MKRKTIRQGGINVHAMAKRILGLGMEFIADFVMSH